MSETMSQEEWEALLEEHTGRVQSIASEIKANVKAQLNERLAPFEGLRAPSKARLLGNPSLSQGNQPGAFITALATAGDPMRFPDERTDAKAYLEASSEFERSWGEAVRISRSADGEHAWSKATLATTDATGGWIVPNALVDEIIKPAVQQDPYRSLVNLVPGVTAYQVDVPWRGSAPARMTIASRGATKENVDLTYNGYTATMYTLTRIHDVANQFLKQSMGAAERDVIGELASAATLGEQYYIMQGSGSSEPYGLQTALTNSAYSNEVGSFSPATTLAGSVAAAISHAAGNLAGRSVFPNAAIVSASTFWLALRQGADEAGFYIPDRFDATNPAAEPVRVFGLPLIPDVNLTQTDDLIVGNFKSLKVYFGDTFRIDSSSVAGNRWDENETGFRGEFEMGLDARPAVYTGNFTRIQDVVP